MYEYLLNFSIKNTPLIKLNNNTLIAKVSNNISIQNLLDIEGHVSMLFLTKVGHFLIIRVKLIFSLGVRAEQLGVNAPNQKLLIRS